MKNLLIITFVALLTTGINHAESLAQIQTVDAQTRNVDRDKETDRLAGIAEGTVGHRERSTGSPSRAETTGEHEAYNSKATTVSTKVDHDCPCGPDCKCPDPMVCKNGDCKRNYVIFFSATWCGPCKRMYPRINELRDAGYIVYVFDADKYKEAAAKFSVDRLPTTIVMNDGKEIARFIGVVSKEKITSITKTKEEQEKARPFDYDFR